jgi:hypothetical protein
VVEALCWSLFAAGVSWLFTLAWARASVSRYHDQSEEELRYWQSEAVRARDIAVQLRLERDAWSKGCTQGRKDVISVLPLLIAAQHKTTVARAMDDVSSGRN